EFRRVLFRSNNAGVVEVLQGTVNFNNGGILEGSFSAASGTAISFSGGSFSNAVPVTLSGAGAIQFTGGGLTLVNDVITNLPLTGGTVTLGPGFQGGTITNLTLSGSALAGGNIVSGTFNWLGGTVKIGRASCRER